MLVVCDYFGEHLLAYCDGFRCCNEFKKAYLILKAKGLKLDLMDMFEHHEVFDIPKNYDFPAIMHYSLQDINHVVEIINKVEIDESKTDYNNENYDEVQDMLQNLKDCFLACQSGGCDLVTFTH